MSSFSSMPISEIASSMILEYLSEIRETVTDF